MITRMLLATIGLTFTGLVKKSYFSSKELNPKVSKEKLLFLAAGFTALFYMTQAIFSF